jgi:signal peptidase I
MTKRKASELKRNRAARQAARGADAAPSAAETPPNWLSSAATRETIESVIIAFVLAFLFRTFEAEAFVIPTGSMAPTLMGKHKDVECPMCHYRYQANASDDQQENKTTPASVLTTTCPMCRYTADVRPGNPQGVDSESYEGDRILVAKFPFEFADPQRWDVVVFKYPGNSTMNYIKRLVGLPGETIRIRNGDLWIHRPGDKAGYFEIARKPPPKILAMLQPVFDNDLATTISGGLGWPARWTAEPGPRDYSWNDAKDLASFGTKGSGKGEAWIRYRHRVPSNEQWRIATAVAKGVQDQKGGQKLTTVFDPNVARATNIAPQLISDFTAYDTSIIENKPLGPNGLHWVGDLAVQFELDSKSASGKAIAELVKGGRHFQCRFDLASGKAELSISGDVAEAQQFHPKATTEVKGVGTHTVIFSNVDDELRLWVDGSVVAFDAPTTYDSAKLRDHIPTSDDLSPVGIGADGAAVDVLHIKVLRDIYYIADCRESLPNQKPRTYPPINPRQQPPLTDFTDRFPDLANPADWKEDFSSDNMATVETTLAPDPANPAKDQFFVLGDNSAQSQDGRLWASDPFWRGGTRQYWVDRELFIGKALFIYWPHGWKIPYVPLPFNPVPYFQRMHLVR